MGEGAGVGRARGGSALTAWTERGKMWRRTEQLGGISPSRFHEVLASTGVEVEVWGDVVDLSLRGEKGREK